jgi:hypothetical protein
MTEPKAYPWSNDEKLLQAIELRAINREALQFQAAAAGPETGARAEKEMLGADVADFKLIQDDLSKEDAASRIAQNMRDYPGYKSLADTIEPEFAASISQMETAVNNKIIAKEGRKAADMASIREDLVERAQKWSPADAAQQALRDTESYKTTQDATARYYQLNDMGLNASANPSYREAVEGIDPGVSERMWGQVMEHRLDADKAAKPFPELVLTAADMQRVQSVRLKDSEQVREALGLNTVEDGAEKEQIEVTDDLAAKRAAWLDKTASQQPTQPAGNEVESNEIFTATQQPSKTAIPRDIENAYLRVGAKFYDPKDSETLVFEDKGNKLETRSNSETVAKSLVRIAEARGWDEIKVSGSESFRKEVWLEAMQHGMSVKGYRVTEEDKLNLARITGNSPLREEFNEAKEFRARESEKAMQAHADPKTDMAQTFAKDTAAEAVRKYPELAGAAAVVAAMDKKAEADGLTQAQRAIVNARVRHNVVNSIERGEVPTVAIKGQVEVEQVRTPSKEYSR